MPWTVEDSCDGNSWGEFIRKNKQQPLLMIYFILNHLKNFKWLKLQIKVSGFKNMLFFSCLLSSANLDAILPALINNPLEIDINLIDALMNADPDLNIVE